MNPLEKQVAEFMAVGSGMKPATVKVENTEMMRLKTEPDYILADLSNGQQLSVEWDPDYQYNRFRLDGKEVAKNQTLISILALEELCREVYERAIEDKYGDDCRGENDE